MDSAREILIEYIPEIQYSMSLVLFTIVLFTPFEDSYLIVGHFQRSKRMRVLLAAEDRKTRAGVSHVFIYLRFSSGS